MRVSGDPDGCRVTAAQLRRTAAAAGEQADTVRAMRQGVPSWSGQAADAWAATVLGHSDHGRTLADRLAGAASVLARHADALAGLQAQARSLAAQAAAAQLVMDDSGWIMEPAPPFLGTLVMADEEWGLLRPEREAVRQDLLVRVRALREEERATHDDLARALDRLDRSDSPAAAAGSPLPVSWWDGPPVVVEGAAGLLARSSGIPVAAAAASGNVLRGLPFVGAGYALAVDVGVKGAPVDEAVARTAISSAAGVGVGAVVGATAVGAALPVVVPVVLAAAAGVAAVAVFDQVLTSVRRDPDARRVDQSTPRPAPGPQQPADEDRPGRPAQPRPAAGPCPNEPGDRR